MKLSVLIASVHTRRSTFLPRILEIIYGQYEKLPPEQQEEVEILTFLDNKKIMLGEKRNLMIDQAQGEYVVFVDDDDIVAPHYISSILEATNSDADVITFKALVTINGENPKICVYSKDFDSDHNTETEYHRLPNHICAVKRSLASQVEFPNVLYGEDAAYSKILKKLLKTQHSIEEVLYYYEYDEITSETQMHKRSNRTYKTQRLHVPSILDLIILSNAKDNYFKGLTEQTIKTALETSKGYKINIIVMEQNDGVSYEISDTQTIHYDGGFHYNAVANAGVSEGVSPWVMVANNDLIFKEDWLFHLLLAQHPVVSPKSPMDNRQILISSNTKGYETGRHFSGWCFMMKRDIWKEIGGFDEDFEFWYADNSVVKQLEAAGYEPMIVPKAIVEHLGSKTLNTLSSGERHKKTHEQTKKFNEKYNENSVIL